jgi:hypothetical protein
VTTATDLGKRSEGPIQTSPVLRTVTGTFSATAQPVFDGTPGRANCPGQSVSALAHQYGGLNGASEARGYASVGALEEAIEGYCEG